jgi:3-deoxy-manno-octulosonate cytidylyltransferase (CMP-KDO synthetase)
MHAVGIIPARYASSRFPGKPLVSIDGVSMIQRVYQRCKLSGSLAEVIVATDDKRIFDHVYGFGGKVAMTSPDHRSGTERCAEIIKMNFSGQSPDMVINIQGDEPFIEPGQIDTVIDCLLNPDLSIATLAKKISTTEELFNPNVVKLLPGINGKALYFSRSVVPYFRGLPEEKWVENHPYLKHIGIYGYKTKVLTEIVNLPPSPLETAESLEQLRWLEHGYSIGYRVSHYDSIAIDTPEDLLKIKNIRL